MDKDEIKGQLESVYKELLVKDPKFIKYKCPICQGYGAAKGCLAGPATGRNQVGKCYYCGGSGVARSPKRV